MLAPSNSPEIWQSAEEKLKKWQNKASSFILKSKKTYAYLKFFLKRYKVISKKIIRFKSIGVIKAFNQKPIKKVIYISYVHFLHKKFYNR